MKACKLLTAVAVALVSFASPLAMAQTSQDLANGDRQDALAEAMEAAEDNAERPGDEGLSCDQLGVELTTLMSDEKLQDVAKQLGAPEDIVAPVEKYNAGVYKMQAANRAFRVLGFLASVAQVAVPGLALYAPAELVAAAETAQMLSQQKRATQMETQMLDKVMTLQPVLPQLMRAAVVGELAENRNCEFLKKLQEK